MSKYRDLISLKKTKARTFHICSNCGEHISPGDIYYIEYIQNKFLHNLHAKKFCDKCYQKFGE